MKALIFNSGIGKRMGSLTKDSPKCMVKLSNGETIFERQIRILSECGIRDFIITTGPFEEQLIDISKKECYAKLHFNFVNNPIYDKTNYIYSFYLTKKHLDDDFLILHGDLVFNKRLVVNMLKSPEKSLCLINRSKKLPEKDFKGRIIDGFLKEVSINIFDEDCFAFQPLYKLAKSDVINWHNNIEDFIEKRNISGVYAENALNEITDVVKIKPFSYKGYFIDEIDNVDDYERVTSKIRMFDFDEQETYKSIKYLKKVMAKYNINNPLIVLDSFLRNTWIIDEIRKLGEVSLFSEFKPNPLYEDVVNGRRMFISNKCDGLISIGGGSAIDTAKAMKLFLSINDVDNFLKEKPNYINLKHIAIPTTAGTGSESTRYSVIYYNDEKQSLTNDMIYPDVVILEPKLIESLPLYQKKSTVFDALCQGIESIWSIKATRESKKYASEAIKLILSNIDAYLSENKDVIPTIQKAANLSGKAINISETTAAHAMSYKIT